MTYSKQQTWRRKASRFTSLTLGTLAVCLAGGDPGRNQANVFFGLASDNSAAVVRAFVKALPD